MPSSLTPARQSLLLFLLALAVLIPGIWETTGLTGKDEFFLGLRTPMEMIEGDHWLVPFLDGAPRIRKPPLLYWLGRTSYELFGISLSSARLVAVLFAALLVVSTAGIARRLSGKAATGWIAGAVMLGCLGLATEGRRFMLDVPVAALSAAAFWCFLNWLDFRRFYWCTAAVLLLAAGFLTKGPIVALVFGGGCLGLLAADRLRFGDLQRHWKLLLTHTLLWALLALPWFFVVRLLYPEAAQLVLADELESRQFFSLSPGIVLGLLNIGLPWVFVFAVGAWLLRREHGAGRVALVWFLATFLPFLLIKSFDRYLIGSLVPFAILTAVALPEITARWPFRLGALVAVLLGGGIAAFAGWFHLGGWYWLILPALYLLWAWWQPRPLWHRLAAPMAYWTALLWGVFPALGVNAVPAEVVAFGQKQQVAMFDGPQPAMLPTLSGQAHRHYARLDRFDLTEIAALKTPVFLEEQDEPRFFADVAAANMSASPLGSYTTLASHGSGLRFARIGATRADWQAAFAQRSLAPLMTTVRWYEVLPQ
ncbi:ArnT family glycosyltransferase [Azonexus sp. IMCC34839]|uniref:ArnT family glycosyltransferase n=1 Tax=Azonexus sp. IMCC34839 TaxID=3133695 RepID=UPI003999C133